jgi:hypothetical protein
MGLARANPPNHLQGTTMTDVMTTRTAELQRLAMGQLAPGEAHPEGEAETMEVMSQRIVVVMMIDHTLMGPDDEDDLVGTQMMMDQAARMIRTRMTPTDRVISLTGIQM